MIIKFSTGQFLTISLFVIFASFIVLKFCNIAEKPELTEYLRKTEVELQKIDVCNLFAGNEFKTTSSMFEISKDDLGIEIGRRLAALKLKMRKGHYLRKMINTSYDYGRIILDFELANTHEVVRFKAIWKLFSKTQSNSKSKCISRFISLNIYDDQLAVFLSGELN